MKKLVSVDVICNVATAGCWLSAKNEEQNIIKNVEELQREIKKHCDYYEGSTLKKNYECSFCGNTWETEDSGLPVCCQKAQEEFKTQEKVNL
jgi:hypothetical protein